MPPRAGLNAVYYWKTVFCPDSAELHFLAEHEIKRLYLRFFDVVAEDFYRNGKIVVIPNATVQFKGNIPSGIESVIPTIYITLDALKMSQSEYAVDDLAEKIVQRVLNMVSYHLIPNVNEIQLDCDWTESAQQTYFGLCKAIRKKLQAFGQPDMKLSATIRLHQLRQMAPPVDYGVLMVYNTGSFRDPNARNSILDYADVAAYLRKNVRYPLPLDVAYPTYEWTLWYRNGKFKGIVRDSATLKERFSAAESRGRTCSDYAEARKRSVENQRLPEDILRKESADMQTLLLVKQLVEKRVFGSSQDYSVILYHLDSKNLSRYTPYEINGLYSHTAL
ncbi:MAG: hypothetical protein NC396_06640 [Bacteroides sp.]|nr:hypothetical protein [Bacteroides sp.]MCM1086034.1 hypothetical protein [Bacteroides sp.]